MLNAFAGITGVALAAPFLATVGLLLGRKALKDERTRQLLQRRNLARQTVRKYADDLASGWARTAATRCGASTASCGTTSCSGPRS